MNVHCVDAIERRLYRDMTGEIIIVNSSFCPSNDLSGLVYSKSEIGYGVGGGGTENSSPTHPHSHPTILSCQVRINGITDFQHKVIQALRPGQSFQIDIKAKIKNQGEEKSHNADLDYRIDKEKNKFDTDDTNLGDDEIDINPGETITEYKRNIKVKLSEDGTKITVSKNNHKESFPINNQEAHFHIFLDIEDNNHHDISSENDKDEYAKVTIQALSPSENSQNTVSQEKLLQEILPLINTLLLN